jgi:hypothetical protein
MWGDRQTGICQYLVMGISWSKDPQGFQHISIDVRAMKKTSLKDMILLVGHPKAVIKGLNVVLLVHGNC